jgi:hypothetical protein
VAETETDTQKSPERRRLPYLLVCLGVGLPLAWAPVLFSLHGPIPQKFDVLYIQGNVAIWSYYTARMLIGFWVGITAWPAPWWLRGPLCGFLAVFPLTLISVVMPGCGPPCMRINLTTATLTGLVVAGAARWITGRNRA